MKDGKWWVEPGILTSGNDPAHTLDSAGFPDEYVPMVFMTGDGHRTPPFQWATRGVWPNFWAELIAMDKVVCHVEKYADDVTANHVPGAFAPVFAHHKVFGWEPRVYEVIGGILEQIVLMMPDVHMGNPIGLNDLRNLTREMYRVHDQGYLGVEGRQAMLFWDLGRSYRRDPVPLDRLPGFLDFITNYHETAYQLRTGIHPVIAAHLNRLIEQYPDHMHLITCGDAHVIENPLYRYVTPPIGAFGIADQNSE